AQPGRPAHRPGPPQLGEHVLVLGGPAHDDDPVEVLRRGPEERHPADVDLLQRSVEIRLAPHGGLEGIERDRRQVDRPDPVPGQLRLVPGIAAHGQQPAVHRRVERLDPSIQDLRESGDLAEIRDRHAGAAERGRGPTGREDLDAEIAEAARELDDPGLVPDAEERPRDLHGTRSAFEASGDLWGDTMMRSPSIRSRPCANSRIAYGYSRCSARATRAARVAGVSPSSTGTAACAMMGPPSGTSVTKWTVAPLVRAPDARTARCTRSPYIPFP